jgi:hypothetical protein
VVERVLRLVGGPFSPQFPIRLSKNVRAALGGVAPPPAWFSHTRLFDCSHLMAGLSRARWLAVEAMSMRRSGLCVSGISFDGQFPNGYNHAKGYLLLGLHLFSSL